MATGHPIHAAPAMDQIFECNAEFVTNDRINKCVLGMASRQVTGRENCDDNQTHTQKICVTEMLPGKILGRDKSGSSQSHEILKGGTSKVDSSQVSSLVKSMEKDIALVDTDGKGDEGLMDNNGAQSTVDCSIAKPAVNKTGTKSKVDRKVVKGGDQSRRGKSVSGIAGLKSTGIGRLVKSTGDDVLKTSETQEPEQMFTIEEIVVGNVVMRNAHLLTHIRYY